MSWRAPFVAAFHCCACMASHIVVAAVTIAILIATKWLVVAGHDPKLFDTVPVEWLFDGAILATLLVFFWLGIDEMRENLKANGKTTRDDS